MGENRSVRCAAPGKMTRRQTGARQAGTLWPTAWVLLSAGNEAGGRECKGHGAM